MRPLLATLCLGFGLTLSVASAPTSAAAQPIGSLSATPSFGAALVAISVSSVDSSIAWYARHLDFRLERAPVRPRPGVATAVMVRGRLFLELAELAGSAPRSGALPNPASQASLQGIYKAGIRVDDLDVRRARLADAGVTMVGGIGVDPTFAGGVRFQLLRDRDGNSLQLFERLGRP